MNDRFSPPIQALPDGEAEVRMVLRLPWEVVATLGQEAGRLAAQVQRPVSLDEAVSHRLRNQALGAHAKPPQDRNQPTGTASHAPPLAGHSPGEQARQAIEKINSSAYQHNGTAEVPVAQAAAPETPFTDARGILDRPTRATGPVNGTATQMPR